MQNKKDKQKEGGGGATMSHNKLEPSKVANEWRSIPLLIFYLIYPISNRFLLITSETIAIVGSFQNGLKLVLIFCEISLLSTEFSLL